MKVFFINNSLTPYYEEQLSKLSQKFGIDIVLAIPIEDIGGDGVKQVDGAYMKVYRCRVSPTKVGGCIFEGISGIIKSEKPDIVICNTHFSAGLIKDIKFHLIKKILKFKLIIRDIPFQLPTFWEKPHNILHHIKKGQNILKNVICFPLEILKSFWRSYVFCHADAIMCYHDKGYEVFGSYGVLSEKIFITGNSSDTDQWELIRKEYKNSIKKDVNQIIHVGRLVKWKNVDILIQAFAELKEEFPSIKLAIIGNGPEKSNLERLAAIKDLGNSVSFLGGIHEKKDLAIHLMSSGIYVLAGMGGLSINDAMCMGLPIICSVCDGTERFLVRNNVNGLFFKDGEKNDLKVKIRELLLDKNLTELMGGNSLKIIQNEANIHTFLNKQKEAFDFVLGKK